MAEYVITLEHLSHFAITFAKRVNFDETKTCTLQKSQLVNNNNDNISQYL